MRVLVTGSHGFVGSNLIEALSEAHEIIRWDVRENQPLPAVDAVIHLAGLAHDTKHTTDADAYFKVNTLLTQQIYSRFLESSAKKIVFFSSIKAQDGDTPYAKSKREAEKILDSARDDKQTYILRPCMIHGKGVKGNLPLLFKVMKAGMPWPLAAFENRRSFASIGNVCFVVSELLSKDVESGIYNLSDDDPISTNELVELICKCLGKKVRLWRIPRVVMTVCARIGDALHLPLNTERLGKLTENYVVDNSGIKQALGIDVMPVGTKEGLKSTINYMIG